MNNPTSALHFENSICMIPSNCRGECWEPECRNVERGFESRTLLGHRYNWKLTFAQKLKLGIVEKITNKIFIKMIKTETDLKTLPVRFQTIRFDSKLVEEHKKNIDTDWEENY